MQREVDSDRLTLTVHHLLASWYKVENDPMALI
jgi:hypothetical protein